MAGRRNADHLKARQLHDSVAAYDSPFVEMPKKRNCSSSSAWCSTG
jgi:hypothetical protein